MHTPFPVSQTSGGRSPATISRSIRRAPSERVWLCCGRQRPPRVRLSRLVRMLRRRPPPVCTERLRSVLTAAMVRRDIASCSCWWTRGRRWVGAPCDDCWGPVSRLAGDVRCEGGVHIAGGAAVWGCEERHRRCGRGPQRGGGRGPFLGMLILHPHCQDAIPTSEQI